MGSNKILIVTSSFYSEISNEMVKGAHNVIEKAGFQHETISVPGAFEVPAAVHFAICSSAQVNTKENFVGFVALGCVIQGETDHYEHICRETTRALMDISINNSTPLGFGILTVKNIQQAKVRADTFGEKNVGGKAAEACLKMIEVSNQFNLLTN